MNIDHFLTVRPLVIEIAVFVLLVSGLPLVWRGLRGDRRGQGGLLDPTTTMLVRMKSFRLMVFGLVGIGLGLSLLWNAAWLRWLALGIGFVEILESSTLIAVWKHNPVGKSRVRRDAGASP